VIRWWMIPIDLGVVYYWVMLIHNAFRRWWKGGKWEWWVL
jgi:hypothetical protein